MQEFEQLSEMEQLSTILQLGKLVSQHPEDECRVFLYRLDNFFVAVSYICDNDQLKAIHLFASLEDACPHLRSHHAGIHPAERNYSTPEL